MDGWYVGGEPPSEEQLRREIAYYEHKISDLSARLPSINRGVLSLYEAHAIHRRKLLAALMDGRPEAWQEYPSRRSS